MNKWLLTIALVCLVTFSACAHREKNRGEADFYMKLGISNLVSQECTEALRYLLEAEKRYAQNAELQNSLGLAYYCKQEHELAIKAYLSAIRIQPDFSEAYNNLGAAYSAVGKYDEAVAAFDKALADLLYNTPERAWLNRGDAFAARFDNRNALASYERSIAVAMPKPQARDVVCVAHNRIGAIHMREQEYPQAVRSLNSAIRLCPQYAEPYAQLSNAYMRLGKRDEAVEACKKVRQLAPDSRDAEACGQVLNYLRGQRS